jgi:uncharacterized protein YifN (PemK superfamily)
LASARRHCRRSHRELHFAIFAYWLVFIIGVPGVRPVVGEITPNSIAAQAQIAKGTELKAIDGIETPDWDAVRMALVAKIGDPQTILTVAPFGTNQRQDKILDLRHWAFEPDKQDPVTRWGFSRAARRLIRCWLKYNLARRRRKRVCKRATGSLKSMVNR